ncbi:unnamed protein product, partial [Heterotrigona itama]
YYMYLMPLLCFILPSVIPVYCWNETWSNAYFVPTVLRYVFTLNITWLVNSAAYVFGNKLYDRLVLLSMVIGLHKRYTKKEEEKEIIDK